MADLSDVSTYLAQAAASILYPNGPSLPSITGKDIRIREGWPLPAQLDLDVAGQMMSGSPPVPVSRPGGPVTNVTIFPMQGGVPEPYQILDETYTIVNASFGINIVSNDGNTVTLSGTPNAGEYLTVIADGQHAFSASGNSLASILSSLATSAQGAYPSASSTATTLTIPATVSLIVRQGGIGTLGKVTHRQMQFFMIIVWAPTRQDRSAVANALDNALKRTIVVTLPDTTQMKLCYNRTNETDEQQLNTIYRRDLIYNCEYATLYTFPGTVITSVEIDLTNQSGDPANPVTSPAIPVIA